MCGIAGVWGTDDERLVRGMMDSLIHRGPDDEGTYRAPGASGVLGHRRLSIMDPVGGHQPLVAENAPRAIVANGEIYNDPSWREVLGGRRTFRTGSDTESALQLYHEVGLKTAERLDGMFSLAIADGSDLYLARDPVGIKPLYYGQREDDTLVFASELKALTDQAEQVEALPPGSWYHTDRGLHRYYDVPDIEPDESMGVEEAARLVREGLEAAVVKRLRSDVPLGAFLSGGLDSSLIAAIARKHLGRFHTFSVGIEGSDDLQAARFVARKLDTIHHEYVIPIDEVRDELPTILYHLESFDQDLVRSGIPCYFTSRLAAEEVKVILTGEGADELFAGYSYVREIADPDVLHAELRRSVQRLHDINLQRVDRLTMAHSIEGRVPFLDTSLIETAQRIPTRYKLYDSPDGRRIEKWILRLACEDLLPKEILWRDKAQFDEGSGLADVLGPALKQWMSPEQGRQYAQKFPSARLRSAEESVYHRLLREVFSSSPVVFGNVARWSEGRPEGSAGSGPARPVR